MSEDDSEKTEEPTQRKLDDARKKGQIASSKEVSNFFMILALLIVIGMFFPSLLQNANESLAVYISNSHEMEISRKGFYDISLMIMKDIAVFLGAPFVLLIFAAVGAAFIQNGFQASAESIMPKLDKISPMKGFKRLFSGRSLVEFIKGIIKIVIVGIVAYYAVIDEMMTMNKTPEMSPSELLEYVGALVITVITNCCVAIFFIAIFDFMYQKFAHIKQLRMTKQEIKEEYKQQEGDPHIKGKLKQMRMEKARRRMMASVPTADVIVTNPIHYAVALKYDSEKGGAPIVVALGIDAVAEKIKEIANEHKVPIVRNPTLARALHADCELDEEIPFTHFQAVAEVISYVYKLKSQL